MKFTKSEKIIKVIKNKTSLYEADKKENNKMFLLWNVEKKLRKEGHCDMI